MRGMCRYIFRKGLWKGKLELQKHLKKDTQISIRLNNYIHTYVEKET